MLPGIFTLQEVGQLSSDMIRQKTSLLRLGAVCLGVVVEENKRVCSASMIEMHDDGNGAIETRQLHKNRADMLASTSNNNK